MLRDVVDVEEPSALGESVFEGGPLELRLRRELMEASSDFFGGEGHC